MVSIVKWDHHVEVKNQSKSPSMSCDVKRDEMWIFTYKRLSAPYARSWLRVDVEKSRLMILISKKRKTKLFSNTSSSSSLTLRLFATSSLVSVFLCLHSWLKPQLAARKQGCSEGHNLSIIQCDIENHSLHHRRFPAFKFKEIAAVRWSLQTRQAKKSGMKFLKQLASKKITFFN